MYSSLDRLINLAKRTGDRLIIHDPVEGRDIVIMDVEHYERLVLERQDVRELSSDQMLDQINRDIAIWRSNKEMDEQWERDMQLEDEADEEMFEYPYGWSADPFADPPGYKSPWHAASDVLEDRYSDAPWTDEDYGYDFYEDEFEDIDFTDEKIQMPEIVRRSSTDSVSAGIGEDVPFDLDDEMEIKVEDIPFEPVMNQESNWEEEPLGDEEPVFLEEPV